MWLMLDKIPLYVDTNWPFVPHESEPNEKKWKVINSFGVKRSNDRTMLMI